MARTASTIRLYSRNSSPTSDTLMSSSVHSRNREFGGDIRMATGEAAADDTGESGRWEAWGGTSSDDRREAGGEVYVENLSALTSRRGSHSGVTLLGSCDCVCERRDKPGILARRSVMLLRPLCGRFFLLLLIMLSKLRILRAS